MARTAGNDIIGAVGSLVFYKARGNNYVRTKPRKSKKKRHASLVDSSNLFADVSRYGTGMLGELKYRLLFPFTLNTYNQQRGWLRHRYATHKDDETWELAVRPGLVSQLNPVASLNDILEADITVKDKGDGVVSVGIPALNPVKDIKAPKGTKNINLKLIVVTSPFRETGIRHAACMEQYTIPYRDTKLAAKKTDINCKMAGAVPAQHIAIVVIALEFEKTIVGTAKYSTESKWLPAAIIAMGRLKG